ncbi:MAG: o-succinylbenzoate synthase [Chlamydiota bacterium]
MAIHISSDFGSFDLNYTLSHFSCPTRQGLILSIEGLPSVEISPLPSRSQETFAMAHDQLNAVLKGTCHPPLYPSVQFGLESLFTLPAPDQKSYFLLVGSLEEILKRAETLPPHSLIKCKVSSLSKEEIQDLITSLHNRFRLRLDCNGKYNLKEIEKILSPFSPHSFDAIEDPTYELDQLCDFSYPFLLDEWHFHTDSPWFRGFVIKPTVWGGKKGIQKLIDSKERLIFSSSLETQVGLDQIARLYHAIGGKEELGIDTLQLFPNPPVIKLISYGSTSLPSIRRCL